MISLLDEIRSFRMDLRLMLDIDDPDSMQRTLDKMGEILEKTIATVEKIERDNTNNRALLDAAGE